MIGTADWTLGPNDVMAIVMLVILREKREFVLYSVEYLVGSNSIFTFELLYQIMSNYMRFLDYLCYKPPALNSEWIQSHSGVGRYINQCWNDYTIDRKLMNNTLLII